MSIFLRSIQTKLNVLYPRKTRRYEDIESWYHEQGFKFDQNKHFKNTMFKLIVELLLTAKLFDMIVKND